MRTDAHWKRIGLHPHHGICLPISALRSKKSCGIGEYLDLLPLIDWCSGVGFDCIQLLPIQDSGDDPSPYNALSSCALNPMYLSLSALPEANLNPQIFSSLNQSDRIRFAEVKQKKREWLRTYFEKTFPALSKTIRYQTFVQSQPWLEIYALFKALKTEFGGDSWKDWPLEYRSPKPEHSASRKKETEYYCFLQFHCFEQMSRVQKHASEKSIFIKGDIPILLSPDSADVWAQPHLFQLDLAAGAPPDLYNPKGQKWGFPLYNWGAMRNSGYAWWKERLKVAENFFHIYRIDHVVGFFRIWAIPGNKKPTDGFFVPADTNLWEGQGRELLEMMIDSSPLLPIAEDLGTIPPMVRPILKELGICGTKVIRWQRNWLGDKSYIPFEEYEPFSMTTVSTPDMDTLKLWWKKYPDESIPFAQFNHWIYQPELSSEQQFEILRSAHHSSSYFHINLLQEYLALFPELVWPNGEDERINIPGTLLPTNWTYRFRPFLEEITEYKPMAQALSGILRR